MRFLSLLGGMFAALAATGALAADAEAWKTRSIYFVSRSAPPPYNRPRANHRRCRS